MLQHSEYFVLWVMLFELIVVILGERFIFVDDFAIQFIEISMSLVHYGEVRN